MKKFIAEFKAFALKGNVMNLAVGVMIGAAFQSVVTSLTDNVISPILGWFIKEDALFSEAEFLGIRYGAFLSSVINFLILALVVFLLVRLMNRLLPDKKADEPAPVPKCPYCLTELKVGATRCPACTSAIDQAEGG